MTGYRTVAAGAGFAGDRLDPAVVLAASGQVDAVVLECLAERTLVPAIRARRLDADQGYDPRLARRLTPLLPVARANDCAIVSNLGAANPVAAGKAIAQLAAELGLKGVRVAAVHGDDVTALADEIHWVRPLAGTLLGAHAYLGSATMATALAEGAHLVVAGRAADSALFAATVRASLAVGDDALAGALAVGHLLECGGQLTGGNYEPVGGARSAPPLSAADYAQLGYPLARVQADGSAEIAVLDGAPGIVDAMTCTLQLLYEVHDPARYATPDLILDFTGIRFEVVGHNRVRMTGARGLGPPPTLKVAGFVERPGAIIDCEIGFAGAGAHIRAQVAADVLRRRLSDWPAADIAIDCVGIDSVLRVASQPVRGPSPELRVHVSARSDDAEAVQLVEDEVYALTLSGPAGGGSVRSERRARLEVVDGFIAPERVSTGISWSTS